MVGVGTAAEVAALRQGEQAAFTEIITNRENIERLDMAKLDDIDGHAGNVTKLFEQDANPTECPYLSSLGAAGIELYEQMQTAHKESTESQQPTIRELLERQKTEATKPTISADKADKLRQTSDNGEQTPQAAVYTPAVEETPAAMPVAAWQERTPVAEQKAAVIDDADLQASTPVNQSFTTEQELAKAPVYIETAVRPQENTSPTKETTVMERVQDYAPEHETPAGKQQIKNTPPVKEVHALSDEPELPVLTESKRTNQEKKRSPHPDADVALSSRDAEKTSDTQSEEDAIHTAEELLNDIQPVQEQYVETVFTNETESPVNDTDTITTTRKRYIADVLDREAVQQPASVTVANRLISTASRSPEQKPVLLTANDELVQEQLFEGLAEERFEYAVYIVDELVERLVELPLQTEQGQVHDQESAEIALLHEELLHLLQIDLEDEPAVERIHSLILKRVAISRAAKQEYSSKEQRTSKQEAVTRHRTSSGSGAASSWPDALWKIIGKRIMNHTVVAPLLL